MRPEIDYVYNKLKRLRFDFNPIDFKDFRSEYRYEPTLDRYVRKDDNDLFIAKDTFKPLEEELEYADKCHNLEEQLGCPLEVVIRAFKKYVSWTTDCDFGYDNIPDEYEAYRNDKRFKTLSYDSGLIYIAIQEALKEDKSE